MAGGTLGTDELIPLLSKQPAVYKALNASFALSDSAFAEVRFGDSYPHLEGRRLGPHYIECHAENVHGRSLHNVRSRPPTRCDAAEFRR